MGLGHSSLAVSVAKCEEALYFVANRAAAEQDIAQLHEMDFPFAREKRQMLRS